MLKVTVPPGEFYDSVKNEFRVTKEQELTLEHSLVSISKWESKWCKPFLSATKMSQDEVLDYIRCMTLTQNVDPMVYYAITSDVFKEITDYMNRPMTATTFRKNDASSSSSEVITSEIIYYWMIELGIPIEFAKWHINRLLTLIRVCNIKRQPPKSIPKSELYARNKALNDARRKAHHTKG